MGKYHSGVHIPKGIKVVNHKARSTAGETKFAKGLVKTVKRLEGFK